MEVLLRFFGGKFAGASKLASVPRIDQKIVVAKTKEQDGKEKTLDIEFYRLSDIRLGIHKELIYGKDDEPDLENLAHTQRIEI